MVCRTIVADDSPDIRLLLSMSLAADDDFELVGEATNGAEAVALVDELRPDLVLLDLSMPVMDGLEAMPLIGEACPETAIIVISGFLNAEVRQQVMQAGALGFVEKGNDFNELVEQVRTSWNER